ncbi:DUF2892 domain-containing protein [Halobacillus yeomjeoni]|uniref:DUF2892 domain-containing protein n=1 Tax=Halobacillus yeomjeoni TaxID=311194 RepID=A0A931HXE4_9BACI|nr:DUF2892 domain-containing protein [Halobacillus yeomjeoni]MBH0231452.1 DUF2892 domain-containing protein [Halobacillus yeomjeoni]
MKSNIGTINAMLRITAGLSMLTFATIRAAKRGEDSSMHPVMVVIGALKVAEGITRYCPLTAVCEDLMYESDGKEEDWEQDFTEFEI